jgi:hypothetical protein
MLYVDLHAFTDIQLLQERTLLEKTIQEPIARPRRTGETVAPAWDGNPNLKELEAIPC